MVLYVYRNHKAYYGRAISPQVQRQRFISHGVEYISGPQRRTTNFYRVRSRSQSLPGVRYCSLQTKYAGDGVGVEGYKESYRILAEEQT